MTKPDIDTRQTPWELDRLLEIVEARWPARILEVGVFHGGTLWHWLQMGDVVAVDDTCYEAADWYEWAREQDRGLTLIQGDCHHPDVVEQIRQLGPYDFCFIDADHTYQSVRADWDNYGPMVKPGGLVGLHDITPRPDYGVDQLWREIKALSGSRTMEIVENSGRYNGIGLCWI